MLRKYFLNSSFSFVYLYCSYFLPRFNPVLMLFICFLNTDPVHHGRPATKQTLKNDFCPRHGHCLFVRANLKGDKVFLGAVEERYLRVGDSWAESHTLTPDCQEPEALIRFPPPRHQQIEDTCACTQAARMSWLVSRRPATLNAETFLRHVALTRCFVHVWDGVSQCRVEGGDDEEMRMRRRIPSHSRASTWLESRLTFILCSGFFDCSRWSGFVPFSMSRTHAHTHFNCQEEIKGKMKRPSHSRLWSMTKLYQKKNQIFALQIKLSSPGRDGGSGEVGDWVGGRGGAVLPPGRSVSPASFQGLTRILLSCQGRVMGAKANREQQRSANSQIWRLWKA